MAHPADRHDLIRVQGARVNNLKDVSVEIPKRRLTVFTGVSGSGKSSLVFGTIAAESQRMINETYSAFVQGFMPTLARPDVDVLDGLTTAIIVDQERMGANARSTVGTATDANALLRVLFSRLGDPYIGPPTAFSFNVPMRKASGAMTVDRGKGERIVVRDAIYYGGMCPRCEGMGSVTDIDLTQLYDEDKSLAEGAISVPGYTADGWSTRLFAESGFLDPDKPIRDYSPTELHDFLYKEPVKARINGINLTYEGLVLESRSRCCPRTSARCSRTSGRSWSGRSRSPPVPSAAAPGSTSRPGRRRSRASTSPTACSMQIDDLAKWLRGLDEPSVAPLLAGLQHTFDSFVEIGLGYLSLDRPSGTLSGGESQRTRMIRHLGSSLTDVTYVFDEPTIGLHPHDIARMNGCSLRLRDKGNTVLVVEHKPEVIEIADQVVDLGPGAGSAGGEVVFEGTVEGLRASDTLTGRHLDDRASVKPSVRTPSGPLEVRGAEHEQPAGRRCRHPARRAGGADRRGRVGQELAHRRFGAGPRRRRRRSTRARSRAHGAATRPRTPACSTRSARRSPRPTASSRRCSAPTPRAPARPATGPASSTPSSGSWTPSPPPARTARASGTRRPCWTTSSAAATSARSSRCR